MIGRLITFFSNLSKNNTKEWFDANRDEYERYVLDPSRAFVVAMGEKLRTIVPKIQAIPITNKSLFRINRDTRFSKDKSPYKSYMGIYLWEGNRQKRMECPGFYLHYENDEVFIGSGMHEFPKDILAAYRSAVSNTSTAKELNGIIKEVSRHPEITVSGEHYKRIPAGHEWNSDNEHLLKHNGLFASIEPMMPDSFHTPELIDFCFERYESMLPIHWWILENLF